MIFRAGKEYKYIYIVKSDNEYFVERSYLELNNEDEFIEEMNEFKEYYKKDNIILIKKIKIDKVGNSHDFRDQLRDILCSRYKVKDIYNSEEEKLDFIRSIPEDNPYTLIEINYFLYSILKKIKYNDDTYFNNLINGKYEDIIGKITINPYLMKLNSKAISLYERRVMWLDESYRRKYSAKLRKGATEWLYFFSDEKIKKKFDNITYKRLKDPLFYPCNIHTIKDNYIEEYFKYNELYMEDDFIIFDDRQVKEELKNS